MCFRQIGFFFLIKKKIVSFSLLSLNYIYIYIYILGETFFLLIKNIKTWFFEKKKDKKVRSKS